MAGTRSPTRPGRTSSSLRTSPALASSDSAHRHRSRESDRRRTGSRTRSRAGRRPRSARGVRTGRPGGCSSGRPSSSSSFLSIFPLVASVALSVSKLVFVKGGGRPQVRRLRELPAAAVRARASHFLGVLKTPDAARLGDPRRGHGRSSAYALDAVGPERPASARSASPSGCSPASLVVGFVWLLVQALASDGGRPGALIVTLIFVFAGIALQFLLGLGLAMLAVQRVPVAPLLPGRLPDPADDHPGRRRLHVPDDDRHVEGAARADLGRARPARLHLGHRPWLARAAVIIGDTWQWTPFVFIVLLAALESLDQEVREAAVVDGASRWQASATSRCRRSCRSARRSSSSG